MTNGNAHHDCQNCANFKDSIFKGLNADALEKIAVRKTCSPYKKGQVIFHEGSKPKGLYCLKSGKVKIYKTGVDGREQIVRLARPGDVVGYRSFLCDEIYTATAAALDESSVCMVEKSDFERVLRENEQLSLSIIQLLSTELRSAEDFLRDMAQKSVRERLAEVLLLLRNKFGTDKSDNDSLSAKLSREELASFVGTATETLIRLLSDLKAERVIETRGKSIRILDPRALVKIANLQN